MLHTYPAKPRSTSGYFEMCRLEKNRIPKHCWLRNIKNEKPITQHRTYCGNKLVNTVRSHTVEVCEVELQVDLVVEHVLA